MKALTVILLAAGCGSSSTDARVTVETSLPGGITAGNVALFVDEPDGASYEAATDGGGRAELVVAAGSTVSAYYVGFGGYASYVSSVFAVEDGDHLRFVAAQKEPYIGAIEISTTDTSYIAASTACGDTEGVTTAPLRIVPSCTGVSDVLAVKRASYDCTAFALHQSNIEPGWKWRVQSWVPSSSIDLDLAAGGDDVFHTKLGTRAILGSRPAMLCGVGQDDAREIHTRALRANIAPNELGEYQIHTNNGTQAGVELLTDAVRWTATPPALPRVTGVGLSEANTRLSWQELAGGDYDAVHTTVRIENLTGTIRRHRVWEAIAPARTPIAFPRGLTLEIDSEDLVSSTVRLIAIPNGYDALRAVTHAPRRDPRAGVVDGSFGTRVDWVTYPWHPLEP